MKANYFNIAATGVKLLAAIVGGVALYAGLSKFSSRGSGRTLKEENDQEPIDEPMPVMAPSEGSQKLMNGLRVGQMALNGTMSILGGVIDVANNINRMFDPSYYKTMLSDPYNTGGYYGKPMIPGYIPGDYPWNNQGQQQGYPVDTPIRMGKDSNGQETYWLKRPNGIIEVW